MSRPGVSYIERAFLLLCTNLERQEQWVDMYHSSLWVYVEENLENSLRRNSGVERAGVLFDAGRFTWLR